LSAIVLLRITSTPPRLATPPPWLPMAVVLLAVTLV
jgi:hypothetical protein